MPIHILLLRQPSTLQKTVNLHRPSPGDVISASQSSFSTTAGTTALSDVFPVSPEFSRLGMQMIMTRLLLSRSPLPPRSTSEHAYADQRDTLFAL